MALGKNCGSKVKRGGLKAEENLGFASRRALGTKRVLLSSPDSISDSTDGVSANKKANVEKISDWSLLHSLPYDILVKVVCFVNHADLKQLFHVSQPIREATLEAKRRHFAYTTPLKTCSCRAWFGSEDSGDLEKETGAPNAPKQMRGARSRLGEKSLSDISVALFPPQNEDQWLRRGVMVES